MRRARSRRATFQLKDAANVVVPATVTYDAATKTATLTPQGALAYGATYTVTVKGGAGGVTDMAGNALAADVSWSFTTEASPPQMLVVTSTANPFGSYLGEILRNEGLNAFTTIDVAFLSPALLSGFDVVLLGETPLNAAQVSTLTGWVNGGGNLIAMRPDKQLAGLLGLTDAGGDALERLPEGRHDVPRRDAGIVGQHDPVPRHGRPLHAQRRHGGRDAVLERDDGDDQPGRDAALGRLERRPGGGVHVRPRPLGRLHAPGQPGLGRPGARRRRRDPARRHVLRRQAGDVQPTGSTRTRSRSRRRTSSSGCCVNLITLMERDKMPLPRFWYLPRGEKAVVVMSGDDHSPRRLAGGTAQPLRPLQGAEPARLRRRQLGVRPLDLLHLSRQPAHARPGRRLRRRRLRGRRSTPSFGSCPTAPITAGRARGRSSTRSSASSGAGTRASRRRSTSRTHCVFWPDWASDAKVELAHGIRMDANYYHYPGQLDRRQARLPERRRLPDALRRPRRDADRRLPAEHEHDRRSRAGVPGHDRRAARQRTRPAGLLRRVRHQHPHRQPAAASRRTRRSSPPRRHAACR